MKVFLVFLALMIVFAGVFAYAEDSLRFMMLQKRLKVLAEECAEAAALCVDEEESAVRGRVCIDIRRGQAAAERLLSGSNYLKIFGKAQPGVKVSGFGISGVRAEVIWRGEDIMRLSFINKQQAARTAAYEWISR